MTTTEAPTTGTAPAVTPCPVPWCDEFGRHLFNDEEYPEMGHTRACRHDTVAVEQNLPDGTPNSWGYAATAAVEVWESEEEGLTGPYVALSNGRNTDVELHKAQEVAEYVEGVIRAATIAFPEFGEQVNAERAVLDAVREWANGRAPQGRIADAYDVLMVAMARAGVTS